MSFNYFSLALFLYFSISVTKKNWLHPVAIVLLSFLLGASISNLRLGDLQRSWSYKTHLVIILSSLIVYIFFLLSEYYCRGEKKHLVGGRITFTLNRDYFMITRGIFVVVFLVTMYILLDNLSSFTLGFGDRKSQMASLVSSESRILNYMTQLVPYCTLCSIFELTYEKKKFLNLIYNFFVIVFSIFFLWFVSVSRGSLLIVIFGMIYIINSKYKITISHLILFMVILIVFLGILMQARLDDVSSVYRGVKYLNNPILTSSYNYIAYSYENLNSLIVDGSPLTVFSNVGISFYKFLGVYDESKIFNYTTSFYNTGTYLSSFYYDLGWFGIIFYPALISVLLTFLYNLSNYNFYIHLFLAILQKPIYVVFFGNYFFTSLSVMFPYLVIFLVVITSKYRVLSRFFHLICKYRKYKDCIRISDLLKYTKL